MNLTDDKYKGIALVKEMLETSDVIKKFNPEVSKAFAEKINNKKALFLTGEGSSRIFPAKRAIYDIMKKGNTLPALTDGATQALEYNLSDMVVFGASNSGKTKELIRLYHQLTKQKHDAFFGLTANHNTPLEEISHLTHVLQCGKEDAVAATKSVIEQALFYDSLVHNLRKTEMNGLNDLADKIQEVLTLKIDPQLVAKMKEAEMIYFAGRNNGVGEELTLKTNEITRKKSDFLEGTYAVHGIEEVMDKNELVIIIEPFESEEEKFNECLAKGVGMNVIAISKRQTSFPTIIIPDGEKYSNYVELAAGWNVLVEIGIALGIDLDKPERARKVGNEFIG